MTASELKPGDHSQTELVESLADIAKRMDLSEIEYQLGDLKIRVARRMKAVSIQAPLAATDLVQPGAITAAASQPAVEHPGTVKSPMVGTVYLRPAPESPAFVEIGSSVKAGDKILLVEAMKTFNEIIAPKGGTITQILVEDGDPVEYGQSLFVIE